MRCRVQGLGAVSALARSRATACSSSSVDAGKAAPPRITKAQQIPLRRGNKDDARCPASTIVVVKSHPGLLMLAFAAIVRLAE